MPPFLGAFFSGVVRGALKTHLASPRLFVTAHTQKGPPLAERPLRTVVCKLVMLPSPRRVPRQPALPPDCQAAAGCQPSPQLEEKPHPQLHHPREVHLRRDPPERAAAKRRVGRGEHWRVEGRSEGTRLNSSHANISYAVFCLKKKKTSNTRISLHATQRQQSTPRASLS